MSEEALKNTVESDPSGFELAESPREFSQLVDLRGYKTKFQSCASGTGWYFWILDSKFEKTIVCIVNPFLNPYYNSSIHQHGEGYQRMNVCLK